MKRIIATLLLSLAIPASASEPGAVTAPRVPTGVSADEAMARLLDGNDRFRYDESTFPRYGAKRRGDTFEHGQKPFAAILACADSRSPVEAIFDQGVGDLFVVRVAGNIADLSEIATIEYGVEHLRVPLVVVLGHTKCGAVTAAAEGAAPHGHLERLIDHIAPAVASVKQREPGAAGSRLVRLAIRANVMQSMRDVLSQSQVVASAVKEARVRVVGGVYDLQTGAIEWLGSHPMQSELIESAPVNSPRRDGKAARPRSSEADAIDTDPPHGDPNGTGASAEPAPDTRPHSPNQHGKRTENWKALAGLLAFSTIGSGAAIHLVYGRR